VKRETGLIALRAEDELELIVSRADELQRVDSASFTSAEKTTTAGIASGFRFLKTDFLLEARVAPLQPQVDGVVRNHVRISDDQVSVSGTVDYTIKRRRVRAATRRAGRLSR
jgi:hypothetical protein